MRSKFDVNLTSQINFRSDIPKWVEQSWTAANYLLWSRDVNICFAFKFASTGHKFLLWFNTRWCFISPDLPLFGATGAFSVASAWWVTNSHWLSNHLHPSQHSRQTKISPFQTSILTQSSVLILSFSPQVPWAPSLGGYRRYTECVLYYYYYYYYYYYITTQNEPIQIKTKWVNPFAYLLANV